MTVGKKWELGVVTYIRACLVVNDKTLNSSRQVSSCDCDYDGTLFTTSQDFNTLNQNRRRLREDSGLRG